MCLVQMLSGSISPLFETVCIGVRQVLSVSDGLRLAASSVVSGRSPGM